MVHVRVSVSMSVRVGLFAYLYADLFLCLAPYIGLSQNVFTNVPVGPWRCYSPAGIEAAEEAPESKDLDNYLQTVREHGATRKTLPKADFAIKIGCVYFYLGPHMSLEHKVKINRELRLDQSSMHNDSGHRQRSTLATCGTSSKPFSKRSSTMG